MARKILENVPTVSCACGCGEQIPSINPRYHYPMKYKHGHCPSGHFTTERVKGVRNNWKGGRVKWPTGYIMIRCEGHPKAKSQGHYVQEHILVMEKHLGRYLTDAEHIHHINGIKDDNRLDNLVVITNAEHMRLHRLADHSEKQIAALREKYRQLREA